MIPALISFTTTAFLLAPLPQSAPAKSPAPPSDSKVEQLVDAIAAEHLAKPGGVGLSVGVARKGQVILAKGYGLADVEANLPADGETLFRIGSITKQFTSSAIMLLVEENKLSLDDTLAELVPEFPTPGHTVTLKQLLNHTSGIPSYTDIGEAWESKWPNELTDAELLALVEGKPFAFEPGQDWAYNNTGYYLLGMIVARTGDTTYGAQLAKTLFEPLGLKRTRYDSNEDIIKNRAQGYRLRKGELANDVYLGMSQPGGAGGLLSTGGELVRWSVALSHEGVVSPESFALMTTPTVLPNGKDTGYGFGLMMDEFAGRKRISHGGGIHGFNSMLLWIPDGDVHVAVISNGEPLRSGKVADAIAYAVLGIEKPVVKDEPTTKELRSKLAGTYHLEALKLDARVFEDGDRLKCQATGQGSWGMKWQGGNEFRAEFDGDVRVVFDEDAKGFTLHQGGGVFHAGRTL